MNEVIGIIERSAEHVSARQWLTAEEAAEYTRTGVKTIYREVRAGRLKAARVGGRRELRLTHEWVDEWLVSSTVPCRVAA